MQKFAPTSDLKPTLVMGNGAIETHWVIYVHHVALSHFQQTW